MVPAFLPNPLQSIITTSMILYLRQNSCSSKEQHHPIRYRQNLHPAHSVQSTSELISPYLEKDIQHTESIRRPTARVVGVLSGMSRDSHSLLSTYFASDLTSIPTGSLRLRWGRGSAATPSRSPVHLRRQHESTATLLRCLHLSLACSWRICSLCQFIFL